MSETSITIRELDQENLSRWDAFVEHCPEATFFHRAGWKKIIEEAFSHRTYFLYAEKGGVIEAVLPLAHIRSYLFGNSLISIPFCVYGGVAAQTERARKALIDRASGLARQLSVDYLELRHRNACCDEWRGKDLYVTFRKAIDPDQEVNLKAIPRKQRAMVRKGIKAGLLSEKDAAIERFYGIYSTSVRNLGTPVFSRRYFELLKDEFGNDCEILTVTHEGNAVSSVLSFYFRDEVLPYYGGGLPRARELKAYDFMYWELMCDAAKRGIGIFDYGRSKKGTGSYSFKKNWGFEPQPLHYEYQLIKSDSMPDVNPLNPKYRLFISLWKRMPLSLSRWIGPMIARSLG